MVTITEAQLAVLALSNRSVAAVETKRRRRQPVLRRVLARAVKRLARSRARQPRQMTLRRPSSMKSTEARKMRKVTKMVPESPSKWTSLKKLEQSRPEAAQKSKVMRTIRWATITDFADLNYL